MVAHKSHKLKTQFESGDRNHKTHTAIIYKKVNLAHLVERLYDKQNVIGSIPIIHF